MPITIGRQTRLAALGVSLATAAAVSLAAAAPALADTTDGTGTATISFSTAYLTHLAKAGVIVIADGPASSSGVSGSDTFTFPVTGGNGTDTDFTGNVTLGGALTFIDAATGKTVKLTKLGLDYFTGAITAVPAGTTRAINLAFPAGALSTANSAGPPSTETFASSDLDLANWGATYLDNHLKADLHRSRRLFAANADLSDNGAAFSITYTATYS